MPGGPTNEIRHLADLWREVKGLESLGVGIGGAGAADRRRQKCAGKAFWNDCEIEGLRADKQQPMLLRIRSGA